MESMMKRPTTAEIETHVRKLLGLPDCDCGQGLYCPEILLNGAPHEGEVLAYLTEMEQDAAVAHLKGWWMDED